MARHEMKLRADSFGKIKGGTKTVELRLNDGKRRQVAVNDQIVFTDTESGETLATRVVARHEHPTFPDLVRAVGAAACGHDADYLERLARGEGAYAHYGKDDESRFGVVGIEICLR